MATNTLQEIIKNGLYAQELNRLVSISEASKVLGVSTATLRRWTTDTHQNEWKTSTAFRKGLEEYRTAGGYRRFRVGNLLEVLDNMRKQ